MQEEEKEKLAAAIMSGDTKAIKALVTKKRVVTKNAPPMTNLPVPVKVNKTNLNDIDASGIVKADQEAEYEELESNPLPVFDTNPTAASPEQIKEISDEIGPGIFSDEEVLVPVTEREIKIDVFEYLAGKMGHRIKMDEPLPADFGYSELVEYIEDFARLNNADIPLTVPDSPEQAWHKGQIEGMGMHISSLLNQDPEVREDREIINDIIAYLKKFNLYTITGKF